jgi:hypothetical protein
MQPAYPHYKVASLKTTLTRMRKAIRDSELRQQDATYFKGQIRLIEAELTSRGVQVPKERKYAAPKWRREAR